MFARRGGLALIAQAFQPADQGHPAFFGLDHIIQVAAAGRDVGVGQLIAILGNQFRAPRFGVSRGTQLFPKDNIIATAPSGPITAISALGQAKFKSDCRCLELITM